MDTATVERLTALKAQLTPRYQRVYVPESTRRWLQAEAAKCERKTAYPTRLTAEHGLHLSRTLFQYKQSSGHQARMVYQCPVCDDWHLTSRP